MDRLKRVLSLKANKIATKLILKSQGYGMGNNGINEASITVLVSISNKNE